MAYWDDNNVSTNIDKKKIGNFVVLLRKNIEGSDGTIQVYEQPAGMPAYLLVSKKVDFHQATYLYDELKTVSGVKGFIYWATRM